MDPSKFSELEEKLARLERDYQNFAYIVSHDLNAPLRGLQMVTDWLQSDYGDQIDASGAELLDLLKVQVGRMQRMLDAVLEFSRIGRLETDRGDVNSYELVTAVMENLAEAKHVTWTIDQSLPTINGETKRLEQLFRYLFQNAAQAIQDAGTVEVTCRDDGDAWHFEIVDDGIGIAPFLQEQVFDFFYTTDTNKETGKLGCGLAFAKKIVVNHGGQIWLDSEPAHGTTIHFTLPKSKKDSQDG